VEQYKPLLLVFGTSADPFHQGHADLICDATRALEAQGVDVREITLMPVFRHHNIQDNIKKSLPLTYPDRLAMSQIGAEQISGELGDLVEAVTVSTLEEELALSNSRPNFTAETMQALRARTDAGMDLAFLIGLDAFSGPDPSFGHWYKLPDLLSSTVLVVCPREGFKPNREFIAALQAKGARMIFLDSVKAREVSSTVIRNRLTQGEEPSRLVGDGSLSQEVLDYILAKGLIHSWRTLDTDQPVMEILSAPSDQDSLEVRLGKLLFERKLTLATAESCTGGLIGHWLTNVPGSSEYYIGGVVSYAYEAKVRMLGVSWDLLKAHGAVSAPVVKQMAKGVRELLSTDLGLSVSGIAGPGGATPTKPVGYAWVGLSCADGEEAFELQFHGDRIRNKESIAQRALELVMEHLEKTGQD